MNISTIIRRPTVIIAAVAVFAAFAGAAQATWRLPACPRRSTGR